MSFKELVNRLTHPKGEYDTKKAFQERVEFVAPCGQRNPIEHYCADSFHCDGELIKCREHKNPANHQVVFLSPKEEVEGSFGSKYFCDDCMSSMALLTIDDHYYAVLFNRQL